MCVSSCVFLLLARPVLGSDNGLGITPPLGWRSYNAFGGVIDQVQIEGQMDVLVNRSRRVDGQFLSLLDLGYNHVGLDGGWNDCFAENGTFHLADGTPVWNSNFPAPQNIVTKAKSLGLSPGWYLNNCGCAENHIEGELVKTIMEGSVRAVHEMGWESLKLDSCSQFHNLTWWAELLNATGSAVLLENCHQGGYAPGMVQFQTYLRNASTGDFDVHKLGEFHKAFRGTAPYIENTTLEACKAECKAVACAGISFASIDPTPTFIEKCFIDAGGGGDWFNPSDLSNSNYCKGTTSPSDCPYNFYRTSGDINNNWQSMLGNVELTVPFLGPEPLSRPGAWAYPDMLEVGRLANFTESRSHFGLWAILSSPLILSFDLRLDEVLDAMWPIISNRDILQVNQRWSGHPGARVSKTGNAQVWAKPLGNASHAVFLLAAHESAVSFSVPFANVSADFANITSVCVRDLYSKEDRYLEVKENLQIRLEAHDSAFYCVRPATGAACAADLANCPASENRYNGGATADVPTQV